jgi:hypothetical protein
VPEDLGIAKFRRSDINDRIARIVCPRAAMVVAVGQPLVLHTLGLLTLFAMPCVNCNHGRLTVFPKTTRIGEIDDCGAREHHDLPLLRKREGQMLPMDEVTADRVAPTHVPPFVAEGIVLIEKMEFTVVIDHTVGVVHPVSFRCEMKLRPKGFLIGRLIHGL